MDVEHEFQKKKSQVLRDKPIDYIHGSRQLCFFMTQKKQLEIDWKEEKHPLLMKRSYTLQSAAGETRYNNPKRLGYKLDINWPQGGDEHKKTSHRR